MNTGFLFLFFVFVFGATWYWLKHCLSGRVRTLLSDWPFKVISFYNMKLTLLPPQNAYLFLSSLIFISFVKFMSTSFHLIKLQFEEKKHPVVTVKSSIKNLELHKDRRIGKYKWTPVRNNFVRFTRSLLRLHLNVATCS